MEQQTFHLTLEFPDAPVLVFALFRIKANFQVGVCLDDFCIMTPAQFSRQCLDFWELQVISIPFPVFFFIFRSCPQTSLKLRVFFLLTAQIYILTMSYYDIFKKVKFRAFPIYAFKAYLLCEISILIYGGIWLFLGHEVVQFLVRFPVHGVFERCCVAGYAEGIE